jgi:DNA-binding response OmpR family regulator
VWHGRTRRLCAIPTYLLRQLLSVTLINRDDVDMIVGLGVGAEDYLTKPVNPRQVMARLKAILCRGELVPRGGKGRLNIGDVVIDPVQRQVTVLNCERRSRVRSCKPMEADF